MLISQRRRGSCISRVLVDSDHIIWAQSEDLTLHRLSIPQSIKTSMNVSTTELTGPPRDRGQKDKRHKSLMKRLRRNVPIPVFVQTTQRRQFLGFEPTTRLTPG